MRQWRLYRWFAGIGDDPRLAVAQVLQMRRQLPLLYGLLIINSLAVAITHRHAAPRLLSLTVPIGLFAFSLWRMGHWSRQMRDPAAPDPVVARRELRAVTIFAGTCGTAYIIWSLALMAYGGTAEQAHGVVYLATTLIGCLFCLIPLPQAALALATVTIPPFIAYCLVRQEIVYTVIAINVTLVLALLLRVLMNSFDHFRRQVETQGELERQHDELARLNDENGRLACTDSLTDLANRRRFQHDLASLTTDATDRPFAVGLLDLDHFKPVNDTYGHQVGDMLLAAVARRAQEVVGSAGTFYRLGGDEFGLLMRGDPNGVTALGERLCHEMEQPFAIGDLRITVGGSLGLALYPATGRTAAELFDRADYALYYAKRTNGGGMCVFTPGMELAIRADRTIEAALQACAFDQEMRVVAQPIVDARNGVVQAVEMLARWRSPLLGDVEPADFIPIAERSMLIHGVTLAIFRMGLAAGRLLPDHIALSFNMSACDLHSPTTIASIEREVASSGIDPGRIWIEITETAVMRDPHAAARVLARLRAHGMKVALDDFGTGYSSLSNLHQLPLDKVKIDRSFMTDLGSARSWAVVRSILGLCHALQLDCVAEGVETTAQLDALLLLGCEHAQGYLFAHPLPVEQLAGLIDARADRRTG